MIVNVVFLSSRIIPKSDASVVGNFLDIIRCRNLDLFVDMDLEITKIYREEETMISITSGIV